MKKILIVIAAALSLFAAGCKTTGGTSASGAKETSPSQICGEWKIESLTGFAAEKIPEATLSVLAKDESEYTLSGYSGVNSYSTTLEDTPKAFPIGDRLASTKMMGAPDDMAFEDELLKVIALAKSWKVEGKKLTVTNGNTIAVFAK